MNLKPNIIAKSCKSNQRWRKLNKMDPYKAWSVSTGQYTCKSKELLLILTDKRSLQCSNTSTCQHHTVCIVID